MRKIPGLPVAAVVIVAAAVVAFAVYRDQVAPFRVPVVTVGGSSVSMRTLLLRTRMSGREPLEMLEVLAREQVVRQVAPNPPYNIAVGEQDIDRFLMKVARGKSESLDQKHFETWVRGQVNESRLSGREFRELVRTRLLMARLGSYLAERVPTVAEQVHLHMIPVKGLEAARALEARLAAGETFARLAREASVDEGLKASGGDTGWHPRGALVPQIARAAFDELPIGEIGEPLLVDGEIFAVVMVSERAAARDLDEGARRSLQDRALDDWLSVEEKRHNVGIHGFAGGYDSETDAWVRWQLARIAK